MTNLMQFKAMINKIAKTNKISAQLVLQNYILERFLERVALSKYKDNYIIKGGFLISSILGIHSRTTKDLDATIKDYPLNKLSIENLIQEIIKIQVKDDFNFEFKRITEIREDDEYGGYRVYLLANNQKLKVPFQLDITTGDIIIPQEIEFHYKLMFEDRFISIKAYNLETVLAEKLDAILSLGKQSTRSRDFYDFYTLIKLRSMDIDFNILIQALNKKTLWKNKNYQEIINEIKNSNEMIERWKNYQAKFSYAQNIDFLEICDLIINLMDKLIGEK